MDTHNTTSQKAQSVPEKADYTVSRVTTLMLRGKKVDFVIIHPPGREGTPEESYGEFYERVRDTGLELCPVELVKEVFQQLEDQAFRAALPISLTDSRTLDFLTKPITTDDSMSVFNVGCYFDCGGRYYRWSSCYWSISGSGMSFQEAYRRCKHLVMVKTKQ